MARSEAMIWATVAASLRRDVDSLSGLVDELNLEDAGNAVYVLSDAVADFYRRHGG